jgi:Contractile injection system tube protein
MTMVTKARIQVLGKAAFWEAPYNPTELVFSERVETTGEGSNVQFKRKKVEDLTVSLFFDTLDKQTDVRHTTNEIVQLMDPTEGTQERKVPPTVVFSWASSKFTGMVTHVERRFTMFLPNGRPVRAELTVTFQSILGETEDLKNQGIPACRKFWTVSENDRLYLIAQQAFGDSSLWRLIADANDIDDPLGFPTRKDMGRSLVIVDVHGESFSGEAYA